MKKFQKFTYYFITIVCTSVIFSLSGAYAAIVTSDFSFGSGTPFGGTTIIGGVEVTLTTTNTEGFGSYSFRDQLNTDPAYVEFTFSVPITEFVLSIGRVFPSEEFLSNFNIGDPSTLTGDLVIEDGEVTSSVPGDYGAGSLVWSGINTTTISFTIGNLSSYTQSQPPALSINEFGINAVPVPASIHLLSIGLMSLIGYKSRRRF